MIASVSVIITTQNRAESLELTLGSFGAVRVPSEWNAELIIVDNASTDHTAQVVKAARPGGFQVHYLFEGRRGKSNALNTALAAARGAILLFTDDDVVPATDWLEKMAAPLLEGRYDGVVGSIQLADHLLRPWMSDDHKKSLAVCGGKLGRPLELIGANMGLRRPVFERIPGFDPELGPGATGFGEETLLTWQMAAAGFRIGLVPEALVIHRPDASRLLRKQWLNGARRRGCSMAYLFHHWEHGTLKLPFLRSCYLSAKLRARRILQPPPPEGKEGCPPWEMSYLAELTLCQQYLSERKRPQNYFRHGLRKINAG